MAKKMHSGVMRVTGAQRYYRGKGYLQ